MIPAIPQSTPQSTNAIVFSLVMRIPTLFRAFALEPTAKMYLPVLVLSTKIHTMIPSTTKMIAAIGIPARVLCPIAVNAGVQFEEK